MVLKKLSTLAIIGSSIGVLAACSATPDQVVTKSSENADAMMGQLEAIQTQEMALQDAFEADLAADESLANFVESGTGATRENLQTRQEDFDELKSLFEDFQGQVESLNEFDETDFTAGEDFANFDASRQLAASINTQMSAYIENYQAVLEQEDAYYTRLAAEDSDSAAFYDGLAEINGNFETSQAALSDMLPDLTALAKLSQTENQS
ncbi:YkyA family protein [Aerococcus sp. NPDC058936]|uniref:YkyA family protein n=1 Tax=Aerococcus sp. NPDC058936 TaxID=3346674 RepID=UPI003672187A